VKKLGVTGSKRKEDSIEKFWDRIERTVDQVCPSFESMRIYQDGLPVCDKEMEIVTELARAGSRNHRLLLRLVENGATVMGTESLELLMEEYETAKRVLGVNDVSPMHPGDKSLGASILARRDAFIANRINETLRSGETGMIFLGVLHSLEPWLSRDIDVAYPVGKPSRGKRS